MDISCFGVYHITYFKRRKVLTASLKVLTVLGCHVLQLLLKNSQVCLRNPTFCKWDKSTLQWVETHLPREIFLTRQVGWNPLDLFTCYDYIRYASLGDGRLRNLPSRGEGIPLARPHPSCCGSGCRGIAGDASIQEACASHASQSLSFDDCFDKMQMTETLKWSDI